MISAIISAVESESPINKELIARGGEIKNRLLLRFPFVPLIRDTVYSVLDAGADECILILGDYADQIEESVVEEIRDDRLIIIKSSKKDINLLESLLDCIENVNYDYCLCIAGHQPNISPDTLKKLINNSVKTNHSKGIVSVLARKKCKYFESNSSKLPFVCKTSTLKKYLSLDISSLDSIFKTMLKDGILFNRIPPIDSLELIDIDTCNDYKKSLEEKNYRTRFDSLGFFSLNNISKNFIVYLIIYIAFCIVYYFLFPTGLNNINLEGSRSMLSVLIQSEASIIAIVITLSLVAVQLTASSYSTRVIDLFKETLSLWILVMTYIIGIVYGLFLLENIYNINTLNNILIQEIWISILLGIFNFFALIPFILDMLNLMKPSVIINKIVSKIEDKDVLYAYKRIKKIQYNRLLI